MSLPDLSLNFPRYTEYNPSVPIYCLTPNQKAVIHRFFDSNPISPSGRYLAVTKFPCEERTPRPGEAAQVIVIDLMTGSETAVAETYGWDTQLGAQVQWGESDDELFFNDMDIEKWSPFGVQFDFNTGEKNHLPGTIYHVSPNGKQIASPCLLRTGRTQLGYGVLAPPNNVPVNYGAPDDDGLFITDLETGKSHLLASLRQIVDACPALQEDKYQNGNFYAFHAKWNPQGDRLMLVVRWVPPTPVLQRLLSIRRLKAASKKRMRKHVVTMAADGSDIQLAVKAEDWARGGHHPNWCPDGRHVMMNLNIYGDGLRFAKFRYDGGQPEGMHDARGSGHPSLHQNGRFILTDTYPTEPTSYGDGTVPIRLIDMNSNTEHVLARMMMEPKYAGPSREMRVDAHPAWDSTGTIVVFNGYANGTRQVFAADVKAFTAA